MKSIKSRKLISKSGERIALNVAYNRAIGLKNDHFTFYHASIQWVDDKISKVILY